MLTDRFRESFSSKVFRSFAVAILIVFAAFTSFFVYHENGIVRKDLYKEGRMLSDLLAYNTRTWVFAENRDMLRDVVKGVIVQKNVLAVAIYNADKKALLVETRKTEREGDPAAAVVPGAIEAGFSGGAASVEKEKTIDFISPVYIETYGNAEDALYFDVAGAESRQSVIGYVKVVLDKNALRDEMRAILVRNGLIALVFLLAGSAAIYFAIRRATMPLSRLAASARSLGRGETIEKVPVESMDEIGRLAVDFNAMYDNLKQREEEKEVLEERLRHAQKMEAIGTLARGIAHDFNNILATLRGSVYLMEKKLRDQDDALQYTGQVHQSLTKAQNLIRGLLNFSRTQTFNLQPRDLNDIVRRLHSMLKNIAGDAIELKTSLSQDPLVVMTDRLQMEQVLMNLCSNARDAMPDGGTISICTGRVKVDEGGPSLGPGAYAVISVGDTGPGIDESIRERIFEPYFTTKDVGKGTGLGLSIVYGIIQRHKGRIEVDAKKGAGTKFTMYLPLHEAADGDVEEGGAGNPGEEE